MSDSFNPFASGVVDITYPLTEVQREIWLAIRLGGDEANASYNESVSLDFPQLLDAALLHQAVNHVVSSHEALRATVSQDGSSLCIMSELDIPINTVDLSGIDEDVEGSVAQAVEEDIRQPFSLEDGPLIRILLLILPGEKCRVIINAHHIVCDGWSYGIVLNELAEAYTALVNNEELELVEKPRYQDYVQREQANNSQNDLNYWLSRYTELPEPLDFPADYQRPAKRTYDADRVDVIIDAELTQQLRQLSREMKNTFFTLSYAAFCAYISRVAQTKDFTIGAPFAGQLSSGMTQLVGHCVNILPFRIQLDHQQNFAEFINVVADETGNGFENPELSFGTLISELAIARDASRVPLVPVTFNLDKHAGPRYFGDQLAIKSSNIRRYEAFDLAMNLVDRGDDLIAEWSFNSNLFSRETILQRAEGFVNFLKSIVDSPSTKLSDFTVTSGHELNSLNRWNQTQNDSDKLLAIPDWFRQTAQSNPDQIAIEYFDQKMTYKEAQARVDVIAQALVQSQIKSNGLIGLFLNRSIDLPLCMLAVMQVGCAYVPLDPQQPIHRLTHILEDADVACMLNNRELPTELQPYVKHTISLDTLGAANIPDPVNNGEEKITLNQLAYVIYTSGSTGKPKGVAISHEGLSNIVRSFQTKPGFSRDDKLLAITTAAFDIAALELFLPLVTGATLCIADENTAQDPEKLNGLLSKHEISVLQCVPTTWRLLFTYGGELDHQVRENLRGWCGGEALPGDLAELAVATISEFWNVYGPTETTIWSTIYKVSTTDKFLEKKPLSIGYPIENTTIYILDNNMQRLPIGVPGMLWIGGAGVATGYHNRVDLTAERFQANPYSHGSDSIIYNTGDMARFLNDGSLEYLGRQDFQVKIRGFRIELGDIESAMLTHNMVKNCVVHAEADGTDAPVLIAYIEVNETDKLESAALRGHLVEMLPAYMIPSHFVSLEALPLNANGKIDRASLPKLTQLKEGESNALLASSSSSFVAASSDLEATVTSQFQKYLGVVKVSMDDDFFENGGDSMSAVRLILELNEELDLTLPLAVLLHSPTPRQLVDKILHDGGHSSIKSIVQLRKQDDGLPIFCLMGINIYSHLANALGDGFNVYALLGKKENDFLQDMLSDDEQQGNALDILGLADEYADLILSTNVAGPYNLLGFSSGGVVAIEVAKRLQAKGKDVAFVGLLDTVLPRGIVRSKTQWLKHHIKDLSKKIVVEHIEEDQANIEKAKKGSYAEDLLKKRGKLLWQSIELWDKHERHYQGNTALFKALDLSDIGNVQFKDCLGWDNILTEGFQTFDVPGNHASLLNEENSKVIAGKLRNIFSAKQRID